MSLGLARAVYYFVPVTGRPRAFLLRTLLGALACGAASAAALPLIDPRGVLPGVAALLLLLGTADRLLEPVMVSLSAARTLAAWQAALGAATVPAVLLPVLGWGSAAAALWGLLILYGLYAALLVTVAVRAPAERPGRPGPGLAEHLRYALPVGAGGALSQVSLHLDRIVAWAGLPLAGFSVYQRGAMEIPLFGAFAAIVLSATAPELVRRCAAGDTGGAAALFRQASGRIALVTLPVFFFLEATADDFVVLLFGARYAGAATVFRLYLLLIPIRLVGSAAVLEAAGRGRAVLACGALLVAIHLPVSLSLLGAGRPWGPAAAMVAAHGVAWWGLGLPMAARALGLPAGTLLPAAAFARVAAGAALPLAPVLALGAAVESPAVALLLGGAVYFPLAAVLLVATGALGPFERTWLRGLVGRR